MNKRRLLGLSPAAVAAMISVVLPALAAAAPRQSPAAPRQSPAAPQQSSAAPQQPPAAAHHRWTGPDGQSLPFASDAEVLDFLRDAKVVSMSDLPTGSTRPKKVLLEKNGLRAHAIFRSYHRKQERIVDDIGRVVADDAVDSALSEAAAYELARLLDLPFVPPTVRRRIGNEDGSLQLWIEHATTVRDHDERGERPPNADWWRGIMQTLAIFDNLVFNIDRNTGNLLIDDDWEVWFIDHTRAFQLNRGLRNPDSIVFAERHLWERLRSLSDDEIKGRLSPFLDGREVSSLLARRERLVHRIDELIERNGADHVLFDYSYDLDTWRHR